MLTSLSRSLEDLEKKSLEARLFAMCRAGQSSHIVFNVVKIGHSNFLLFLHTVGAYEIYMKICTIHV